MQLDDDLVAEAKRLGHHKTKRAAVDSALKEYVERRKRRRILSLFGKLDWPSNYDYKAERRRRV